MAKPAQLPRWANGAGAEITPEPTEGKKDLGWTPGEKPPAQYQNWWMRRVYEWCAYLDGLTNEALTWAAKHTFQGGAASPVMPAAWNDLVNKSYSDAGADSAKAYGDGLIVALKAAANAWSQRQTFNGGATVPAPVNATDAVTKTYADARETAAKAYGDGLIAALMAAANTWAAKQTFSAGMDVTGKVALVQAALQQILKTGGKLQVGTGDAQDVELVRLGVAILALTASGVDLKTNSMLGVGRAAFAGWNGDVGAPADGTMWYRSDLKKLRALLNGVAESLATESYVAPATAAGANGGSVGGGAGFIDLPQLFAVLTPRRAVLISVQGGGGGVSYLTIAAGATASIRLLRDATVLATWDVHNPSANVLNMPLSLVYVDATPGVGAAHTWKLQMNGAASSITGAAIVAAEL